MARRVARARDAQVGVHGGRDSTHPRVVLRAATLPVADDGESQPVGGHILYFNDTQLSLAAVAWEFFQSL